MRRVKKLRNGKKREKGTKNGADIAEDPAFRAIVELAKSLQAICRQSYELMRPIVNDACKNPQTVDEDELAHLFDQVLIMGCGSSPSCAMHSGRVILNVLQTISKSTTSYTGMTIFQMRQNELPLIGRGKLGGIGVD